MCFLKISTTVFIIQLVSHGTAFMLQMQNMNLKNSLRAVKVELNHIIELMHYLNSTYGDAVNPRGEDIPQKITAAIPNDESTVRNSVESVKEKIDVVIPLIANTPQADQKESSRNSFLGTFEYLIKAMDETPVLTFRRSSVTIHPEVIKETQLANAYRRKNINYPNLRSWYETETKTTTEPLNLDNIFWNIFNPKTTGSKTLQPNKTRLETHRRRENSSILYSLSDYIPRKGSSLDRPNKKSRALFTDSLCLSENCGVGMMSRSNLNRPVSTRYTRPFSQYNPLHSLFLRKSTDLDNLTSYLDSTTEYMNILYEFAM